MREAGLLWVRTHNSCASSDTFGFDVSDAAASADADAAEAKPKAAKSDLFEGFDPNGTQEAYSKLAFAVSSKLVELQGNLHYMHLVTELAKVCCLFVFWRGSLFAPAHAAQNLATAMSVEEIASVVAAMEVVKNAKRVTEKGGTKKKKKPVAKGKYNAAREDMVTGEFDDFL